MFHLPPLDSITAAMEADSNHEVATMGWNLFHDRRINSGRFDLFTEWLGTRAIGNGKELMDAINDYHWECVKKADNPHFLDSRNRDNFYEAPNRTTPLHSNKLLAGILNLGGLGGVFGKAESAGVSAFRGYSRPVPIKDAAGNIVLQHRKPLLAPPSATQWLDDQLPAFKITPSLGFDYEILMRNRLLCALLQYMNDTRRSDPFEPVWVTLWSEFRKHNWRNPNQWHELVGLTPPKTDTWLLLLRYPVGEAGKLVRPTQLEAGKYWPHFPVPPSAIKDHPMEMNERQHRRCLLPEYIHQRIDLKESHLFAIARVSAGACEPKQVQRKHWSRLSAVYDDLTTWANRPHPAFR